MNRTGAAAFNRANPSSTCGARLRDGGLCDAPLAPGKRRCRSHGGAPGSGAPKGNKNALKHGAYTAEKLAFYKRLRQLIRESRRTIASARQSALGR